MYTANTMSSAIEAMGMSLPYSSSVPAEDPLKKLECRLAGRQVLLLLILFIVTFAVAIAGTGTGQLLLSLPFLSLLLLLLLSLMLYDVPLFGADRQTLRSQGAHFQRVSAFCAKLACVQYNNGCWLSTWLIKHFFYLAC